MTELAKRGRKATHSSRAQARRAKTQRRQAFALKAWDLSELPDWLTEKFYREEIQPRLASITIPTIASALGLSQPYAAKIRAGRQLLHPRHWLKLAGIARVSPHKWNALRAKAPASRRQVVRDLNQFQDRADWFGSCRTALPLYSDAEAGKIWQVLSAAGFRR